MHCKHPKTLDRQILGIQREKDQYKIEAKQVKKNINLKFGKKLIVHYLHHLGIGGTAKVVQILCKNFMLRWIRGFIMCWHIKLMVN